MGLDYKVSIPWLLNWIRVLSSECKRGCHLIMFLWPSTSGICY